ncbi:MAG: cobalamin biosynthesis protein [Candidatus Acetothermia bacterium]
MLIPEFVPGPEFYLGGAIPAGLSVLVGSVLLDLVAGEPPETFHPVVWIGRAIEVAKKWFARSGGATRAAGALVGVFIPLLSGGIGFLLIALSSYFWKYGGLVPAVLLLKSTISIRSLLGTAESVGEVVESEPERAREELLALVGRNRSDLSRGEMRSAAVESLFENLVDSFVAPLFYFFLGSLFGYGTGVGLAVFYKAVNTLDSMLGYRTDELRDFGYLSARLDDVLNWFPARISAPLVSLAAFSFRALSVACRDWKETPSPNSGWPMGAAAGGLGVKLSKRGVYVLGGEFELPEAEDLEKALGVAKRSIGLYLLSLVVIFTVIVKL